jgi:predicted enzyme related to lactoylglutathione lyase
MLKSATMKDTMHNPPPLTRVILYVRDIKKSAEFYMTHFGFIQIETGVDDLIHLNSPENGFGLTILQAAKSVKLGHAGIKLVFHVPDVEVFKKKSMVAGLKFGTTHKGSDYAFANAKDPSGNSIQISSRQFK